MASYGQIKARMAQLQDDSFYGLAELICDLEERVDKQADRIAELERDNDALETRLAEHEPKDGDQ